VKVYYNLDEFSRVENAVVTSGTFDGVHKGHRKILDRLREIALNDEGETVLLTFSPHPRLVLYPDDNELKLLNSIEEKIELLDEAGLDHLIICPFSREFSRLTSVEYVRDILVNKLGTNKLVIGYNHHFGRNREGSLKDLVEFGSLYGFQVEEIPAQDVKNVAISSTKIRNALLEGDVKTANSYLGSFYSITGEVVAGDHLGTSIGFPTANVYVADRHKLIPADGVYAVQVNLQGNVYDGMLNIGMRPTLDGKERRIEVNIFNFDKDIYGEEIKVLFIGRIRKEIKFEDLSMLKIQLQKDQEKAIGLLAK